jgi:hypothetical protein
MFNVLQMYGTDNVTTVTKSLKTHKFKLQIRMSLKWSVD